MHIINIGEQQYELQTLKGDPSKGSINGKEYAMDLIENGSAMHIIHENKSYSVNIVAADYDTKTFTIRVNNGYYELQAKDKFDLLLEELGMEDLAAGKANDLKAPMPGMVLEVAVQAGTEVKKGDKLVVLEAMKMENVLKAESDATVKAIHVEKGKAVEKNQIMVEFDA